MHLHKHLAVCHGQNASDFGLWMCPVEGCGSVVVSACVGHHIRNQHAHLYVPGRLSNPSSNEERKQCCHQVICAILINAFIHQLTFSWPGMIWIFEVCSDPLLLVSTRCVRSFVLHFTTSAQGAPKTGSFRTCQCWSKCLGQYTLSDVLWLCNDWIRGVFSVSCTPFFLFGCQMARSNWNFLYALLLL